MPRSTAPPRLRLRDLVGLAHGWEEFAHLAAALRAGRSGTIDGVWGSSAPLAVAALASEAPAALLVVLPHPADLEFWARDLETFLGTCPETFPAWEPAHAFAIDEIQARRLALVKRLRAGQPARLLTTLPALMQPIPGPKALAALCRTLRVSQVIDPEELLHWLVSHGYTRRETVELPGEFCRRGGIVDFYSPDAEAPCRIEFFGDEIASLRHFAPETQRSLGDLVEVELAGLEGERTQDEEAAAAAPLRTSLTFSQNATLMSMLPAQSWIVLVEPEELKEQGQQFMERLADPRGLFTLEGAWSQMLKRPTVVLARIAAPTVEAACHLRVESVERLSGELKHLASELESLAERNQIIVACPTEGERLRLAEILGNRGPESTGKQPPESEAPPPPDAKAKRPRRRSQPVEPGLHHHPTLPITLELGQIHAGFRLSPPEGLGVVVVSAHELFRREHLTQRRMPVRKYETRAIDSFLDLAEGELVVHVAHGIARFRGLQTIESKGQVGEHLLLEFAEATRLYVPIDKIDLVQKYVGGGRAEPELSRLGGTAWTRRKEKVAQAVEGLATEMLDLQARRDGLPGLACGPDSEWQKEFEAAFPYQETPDQLTALGEIKGDLERARPMDRLICGDVGFGKTELAIRAAFKVVDQGRQVAVLVPTTLLAEQHHRTFSQRLAEYPFQVACLSRFRTAGETRRILQGLAEGSIDVAVGTHRLLSRDVRFRDLGLVVIDEEQRFGVEHKERLKKLRHSVDVLTMTATPIPRTLHYSLLGLRDISNLETPPRDRLAIETRIHRFDRVLIRQAILRELNREGQVYFVNNRVQNIHVLTKELEQAVPEARFVIGHGQMAEDELEEAVLRFLRREADVLVATTIIENGLDIPSANTIFINEADQYGLADLHQLRGRVGRSHHRAYCYLLIDPARQPTPQGLRRLKAVEEFTELGAGFRIAMRDLEIRGAGNILGTEQSGHIATVGYELYCQMLEGAVRRLKKQPLRTALDVNLALPVAAFLPRDYIPTARLRMEVYRRLARTRSVERLADLRAELVDRFGPVPEPTENLLKLHELRLLAARWQVASIHLEERDVILGYRNQPSLRRLAEATGGRIRLLDDVSASLRLRGASEASPAGLLELLKAVLQSGSK